MADLSHWFAQACEYHDSEGTFKVICFQDRQELMAVVEELLRHGDSWRDDLFSSNMRSNVYKSQNTMPSPDTGSWEPTNPYSPVPVRKSVSVPVFAGDHDSKRVRSGKLFDDLPNFPSDGPQASTTLDQDVIVYKGGNKGPPSQPTTTNSSKNYDLVQEAKKKEEIKYKKSIEQSVFKPIYDILPPFIAKFFPKAHRVQPLQTYKNQDQDQGGSSLPRDMPYFDDDPYKYAKPLRYCLIFGNTTEFNPSGVWIIEELYNDMQE